MDVLLIISNPASEQVALGLAAAATRSKVTWGAFFTNDGVKVLGNAEFAATIANAESAIACKRGWSRKIGPCHAGPGSIGLSFKRSRKESSSLVRVLPGPPWQRP